MIEKEIGISHSPKVFANQMIVGRDHANLFKRSRRREASRWKSHACYNRNFSDFQESVCCVYFHGDEKPLPPPLPLSPLQNLPARRESISCRNAGKSVPFLISPRTSESLTPYKTFSRGSCSDIFRDLYRAAIRENELPLILNKKLSSVCLLGLQF